jgi:hypothetical protein
MIRPMTRNIVSTSAPRVCYISWTPADENTGRRDLIQGAAILAACRVTVATAMEGAALWRA